MANFNPNELILEKIRAVEEYDPATMELTGRYTQVEDPSLKTSADGTDVTDAMGTPIQTFFKIVLPIAKPTCVTVTILQAMWIWNDYLLPSLVLDQRKYKTVPMAVQYLKGGYGSVDMGAMMGTLVLAIVPIIIFYLFCQRYIIEGVVAGAVKG